MLPSGITIKVKSNKVGRKKKLSSNEEDGTEEESDSE